MPLSMYQASVPAFVQILTALSGVLDKAQAHADGQEVRSRRPASARLAPDMFPLSRQVQIACDFAKGATARLAGSRCRAGPTTRRRLPSCRRASRRRRLRAGVQGRRRSTARRSAR